LFPSSPPYRGRHLCILSRAAAFIIVNDSPSPTLSLIQPDDPSISPSSHSETAPPPASLCTVATLLSSPLLPLQWWSPPFHMGSPPYLHPHSPPTQSQRSGGSPSSRAILDRYHSRSR